MVTATLCSLAHTPDILYRIFSYFDADDLERQYLPGNVYESRRSLVFAARTCRAFADPALRVLWSSLPDDQPLADLLCILGIAARERSLDNQGLSEGNPRRYALPNQYGGFGLYIPDHTYEPRWRQSRGYDVRYFFLHGGDPRRLPQWTRFQQYASYVRAIILFAFDGPRWSKLWEKLRSSIDGAPILPGLSSVSFCCFSSREITQGIFALISHSAFRAGPGITTLRLALPPSTLGPSLLRNHCSYLRHLQVTPRVNVDDLRLLDDLHALEHLSISLSSDLRPLHLTLPSLVTLVIAGHWKDMCILLDTMRLPSMQMLSMTGWEGAQGEADVSATELVTGAIQCFSAISTWHPSITSLCVNSTHTPVEPRGCVVPYLPQVVAPFNGRLIDTIRPLLALRALRYIAIRLPSYFGVVATASDGALMADAWRNLEELHLDVRRYSYGLRMYDPRPCGIPQEGIAHFARKCPRLRVLRLPGMEMEMAKGSRAAGRSASQPRGGVRRPIMPKLRSRLPWRTWRSKFRSLWEGHFRTRRVS
ncbi:hypothetical protein BD310DRAFT_848383 [Dichomitus squalens]|uniref:F-box domain-containing protein n=1 Tax=Dichomitus squalens TaxID=114155 RepID=A0A4Q9Q0H8_9APHY|nr:hypothetical protein BD310DRAFT_848383 [Dichomitus squalens]